MDENRQLCLILNCWCLDVNVYNCAILILQRLEVEYLYRYSKRTPCHIYKTAELTNWLKLSRPGEELLSDSRLQAVVSWSCFLTFCQHEWQASSEVLPSPVLDIDSLRSAPETERLLKKLATRASEMLGSNSNQRRLLHPNQDNSSDFTE